MALSFDNGLYAFLPLLQELPLLMPTVPTCRFLQVPFDDDEMADYNRQQQAAPINVVVSPPVEFKAAPLPLTLVRPKAVRKRKANDDDDDWQDDTPAARHKEVKSRQTVPLILPSPGPVVVTRVLAPSEKCALCSKPFSTAVKAVAHASKHSELRRFACQRHDCPRTFAQSQTMNRHMRNVHDGVRPFKCDRPSCSSFARSMFVLTVVHSQDLLSTLPQGQSHDVPHRSPQWPRAPRQRLCRRTLQ